LKTAPRLIFTKVLANNFRLVLS